MSISPTIKYTDARGYEYVETSDWLKQVCTLLPCFEALQWPDYASKVVRDVIDGQDVVIQLWKGWCPKIFEDFPGGIGAEAGVYHTVLERALPASLPLLTSQAAAGLTSIAELADEFFWWPFPELGTTIEFNLTNPVTNQTFLSAGPETRYWMNKWMNDEVVQRHGEGGEVGGGLGLGQPPIEVGGLAGGLQGGAFVADLRQQDISTTLGESLPVRRFHPLKRWHQTE